MEDKEAIYWSRFHPNCGFVPIMVDGIDIAFSKEINKNLIFPVNLEGMRKREESFEFLGED